MSLPTSEVDAEIQNSVATMEQVTRKRQGDLFQQQSCKSNSNK